MLQGASPCSTAAHHLTIVSGGAHGSDAFWVESALELGLAADVFSFDAHLVAIPPGVNVHVLSKDQCAKADLAIKKAARTLRRSSSRNKYVTNLFRRNAAIAGSCDMLLAVAIVTPQGNGVHIAGGTGWTCQMFADRFPAKGHIPLFVADQFLATWKTCTRDARGVLSWIPCQPPVLCGLRRVGAIGPRDLNTATHRNAIRKYMELAIRPPKGADSPAPAPS